MKKTEKHITVVSGIDLVFIDASPLKLPATYVSLFKLVHVVLAVDQPAVPGVPLVPGQIEKDGGVRAAAADGPGAHCHPVFDHCHKEALSD